MLLEQPMIRNDTFRLLDVFVIVVILLGGLQVYRTYYRTRYSHGSDARLSNLTTNLQSIRAQLELYRLHHNGKYPTDIRDQLTGKTDSDGTPNAAGAYGPYLKQFPANPFVRRASKAVKTSGAPGEGWSYDPATGVFLANTRGHGGL